MTFRGNAFIPMRYICVPSQSHGDKFVEKMLKWAFHTLSKTVSVSYQFAVYFCNTLVLLYIVCTIQTRKEEQ
jgi:hypothetical protein